MSTPTPSEALDALERRDRLAKARSGIRGRLHSLARRTQTMTAEAILELHDVLDDFRDHRREVDAAAMERYRAGGDPDAA